MNNDDPWFATPVPSLASKGIDSLDLNNIKTDDLIPPLPSTSGLLPPTCFSFPPSVESLQSVPALDLSSGSSLAEQKVPSTASCEQPPGERAVATGMRLPVHRYPGKYEFAVNISPNSKRVPNFSAELNTLFIQNQTSFAVEFHMPKRDLPPNMYVEAMVCYSDPTHFADHGPILPCSCNAHINSRKPEYRDRYMISTSKAAHYSEISGHRTVSIKLDDMQTVNEKYTAVYSYASYTSCLAKSAKVSTIFTLMHGDKVEGRDAFFCNVCACPPRDMSKAVKRTRKRRDLCGPFPPLERPSELPTDHPSTSSAASPLCLASPSDPSESTFLSLLQLVDDDPDICPYPDSAGFYEFRWNWRVKDLKTFYYLCSIKRGCIRLQERLLQSHEETP